MDKGTPTEASAARSAVEAALIGHRPRTERRSAPRRPAADHTTTLARRLERLARQALPQALRHLRCDPTDIWLLAHDPDRAVNIDAKRGGVGMGRFNPADPADMASVAKNDATRERRRKAAAGRARQIGAGEGEVEIAGTSMAAAPADSLIEAAETLAALRAAGLIDAAGRRTAAPPATCGDNFDDAPALPVVAAASLLRRCLRTVQTKARRRCDAERAGQLVLPCVPAVREIYKARPRGSAGEGATP